MKQCAQLSNNKRCKLFHLCGDKDRITNLDENLLSQILSRLPTKDVVRTSILSKGWRYKWTISYNMDISDMDVNWVDKMGSFVKFMDRILEYSRPQTSFRLICWGQYGLSRVQGWFTSALNHRLEVLKVTFFHVHGIVIPCSLLNSTWLKELELQFSNSTLNVAERNCAPNLTSLYVSGVDIVNVNHNTSTTVKFNFPLLETLTLSDFKWLNVKCVELHAPSLTTFSSAPRNIEFVEYDYSVVILAPRLAMFTSRLSFPEKFIMNGSSIVFANLTKTERSIDNLELLTNIGIRVRNLLNGFNNLEELQLSDVVAKVSQLGPPLQRHVKLRQLKFHSVTNPGDLLEFLHAAPSLKKLEINLNGCSDYDYGAMRTVPSCIVSHLEEVDCVYGLFGELEAKYNLLKFLLKNGEKLKKLMMMCVPPKVNRNQLKEFVSAISNVELVFGQSRARINRTFYMNFI